MRVVCGADEAGLNLLHDSHWNVRLENVYESSIYPRAEEDDIERCIGVGGGRKPSRGGSRAVS